MTPNQDQTDSANQLISDVAVSRYATAAPDESLRVWFDDLSDFSEKLKEDQSIEALISEECIAEAECIRDGIHYISARGWTSGQIGKAQDLLRSVDIHNTKYLLSFTAKQLNKVGTVASKKLSTILLDILNAISPFRVEKAQYIPRSKLERIMTSVTAAIAITLAGLGIMPKECADQAEHFKEKLIEVAIPQTENPGAPAGGEIMSEQEMAQEALRQELLEVEKNGKLTMSHFLDRVEKELEHAPSYEVKEAEENFKKEVPELKERVAHTNEMDTLKEATRMTKSPPNKKDTRNTWARSSQLISNPEKIANCEARVRATLRYLEATRPDVLQNTHVVTYANHVDIAYFNKTDKHWYAIFSGTAQKLTDTDLVDTEIVDVNTFYLKNFLYPKAKEDRIHQAGVATNSALTYWASKKLRTFRPEALEKNVETQDPIRGFWFNNGAGWDDIDWNYVGEMPEIALSLDESFFKDFPKILQYRHHMDVRGLNFANRTFFPKGVDGENNGDYYAFNPEQLEFLADQKIREVSMNGFDDDRAHFLDQHFSGIKSVRIDNLESGEEIQRAVSWLKKHQHIKEIELKITLDTAYVPVADFLHQMDQLDKNAKVEIKIYNMLMRSEEDIRLIGERYPDARGILDLTTWKDTPREALYQFVENHPDIRTIMGPTSTIRDVLAHDRDVPNTDEWGVGGNRERDVLITEDDGHVDELIRNVMARQENGTPIIITFAANSRLESLILEACKQKRKIIDRRSLDKDTLKLYEIILFYGRDLNNQVNIHWGKSIGTGRDYDGPSAPISRHTIGITEKK